jgi:hypothetical protein
MSDKEFSNESGSRLDPCLEDFINRVIVPALGRGV